MICCGAEMRAGDIYPTQTVQSRQCSFVLIFITTRSVTVTHLLTSVTSKWEHNVHTDIFHSPPWQGSCTDFWVVVTKTVDWVSWCKTRHQMLLHLHTMFIILKFEKMEGYLSKVNISSQLSEKCTGSLQSYWLLAFQFLRQGPYTGIPIGMIVFVEDSWCKIRQIIHEKITYISCS